MHKKTLQTQIGLSLSFMLAALVTAASAGARDLRIVIPRRGLETPVQRLNREGVQEIQKHRYKKAEDLFYKAYLYDPSDPFTLNNLGYVSEIEGQLSRAEQFYRLADEQSSDAEIAFSSEKRLKGQPMVDAVRALNDTPMKLNRMNIQAIELLSKNDPFEAVKVLHQALAIDPNNAFTLNNLGAAQEATGDFPSALRSFEAAAHSDATSRVLISPDHKWIGRSVHELAARNTRRLQTWMKGMSPNETRAMTLAINGVSAVNQNQWDAAKQDFLRAYLLSPNDAFALNNRGYVAEREGHLESAQFYYSKAWKARNADAKVGWTTIAQISVKPQLKYVARTNNADVNQALAAYSDRRRKMGGPIVLIPRNNGVQPATPASKPSAAPNSTDHLPSPQVP